MTALALVSAKAAPGVSTSALLLAAVWPSPALLVEADLAGGDLRYYLRNADGQPLRADPGVVSLLAAHTLTGVVTDRRLLAHAQHLQGGLPVLIGPGNPAQAEALRGQWPQLATAIAACEQVVVADLGRIDGQRPSDLTLLRTASLVLVVCRGSVASLGHTRDLLARLAGHGVSAQALLVGTGAQREDAQHALGVAVQLLPHDPTAAASLLGDSWSRKLDRSPLVAAGRRTATLLHEQLHQHVPEQLTGQSFGAVQRPMAAAPGPRQVPAR